MNRVIVSKWCAEPAKSRKCLKLVLADAAEIDAAIAHTPWTSDLVIHAVAKAFHDCILKCGGSAQILE
jgi:hypothetical protein